MKPIALALALLAASALTPASAAQFTHNADSLYVTGPIEQGDNERFVAALDNSVKIVSLTSEGGRVVEAMDIGRAIRRYALRTEVPAGFRCTSACALIWSGGTRRTVDGSLIFHCPRALNEQSCNEPARQSMMAYLRSMGVSEKLVTLQESAGLSIGIWAKPEDFEPAPAPKPMRVADGRDGYYEPPIEDEPLPPRYRRPPAPEQYYGPPYGPPPGWIVIPSEQRAMPCLPTLLSLGLVRRCL
jgi:hypothetical protein